MIYRFPILDSGLFYSTRIVETRTHKWWSTEIRTAIGTRYGRTEIGEPLFSEVCFSEEAGVPREVPSTVGHPIEWVPRARAVQVTTEK